jgi:uncharacterized damage-inducible protein DinB
MQQIKWFDRKFTFAENQNIFPSIIERLSGTPLRLTDKISHIHIAHLTVKINDSWSILENIGHLIDLEPLWQGRLMDILNNVKELRPTDLQNRKTDLANHNGREVESLLKEFSEIRNVTLNKLETLTEEDIFKSSLHPRLKTPMRTMDLFLFVAEHDDHHLARITEINKILSQGNKAI